MNKSATRIILFASSRSDGNTAVIANYLSGLIQAPIIDLSARPMAPFSYDNDYPREDAFLETVEQALGYDEWILLTPVYWYTMSAQMKVFFDRLSDILKYHVHYRPHLVGKGMWALCCSSTQEPIPHFFTPFQLSAEYLEMLFLGQLHTWGGRLPVLKPEVRQLIDEFVRENNMLPLLDREK